MHGIWIVDALVDRPIRVFEKTAEDSVVDCIDHKICVCSPKCADFTVIWGPRDTLASAQT
ncbi:uncharacterized protein METZ01_LOCUS57701 [marine metagenome]|uniref:Uncharacterized protein n=1 Tax=marine metagenome TaxID=408172 RepID=A0A381SR26_9ZZZZ